VLCGWASALFVTLLVTHDVDEALSPADRVLSPRPGRVVDEVTVDAPRPRRHDDPHVRALCKEILTFLGLDWT
jgi:sulfonate transport system ATP-binding protein